MRIEPALVSPAAVQVSWLILGVFEGKADDAVVPPDSALGKRLAALFESKDLTGSVGETMPLYGPMEGYESGSILIVGLGSREKWDGSAAFTAGLSAGKRLAAKPRGEVAVAMPAAGLGGFVGSSLLEGLIVGTRSPGLRKSEVNRHPFELVKLVAPADSGVSLDELQATARRAEIVGQAVNLARDLVNMPPSEKPPTALAEMIREQAAAAGIEAEVWDQKRITQERMGGLLGVSRGSDQPPAFVTLTYRGGGDGPVSALVGKGVTFDSGGLSIKPSSSMEDMKSDMTGAAVVASAVIAAAKLGIPVNLTAYLAFTENMTGGSAMKLGDVLTMRNNVTVEVLNTDAEGRLILADALALAAESKPARMINLATLTGSCMVALGTKIAGLYSNDDGVAEAVQAASKQTGERTWRMPIDDDFDDQLKSSVADCKNVGGKWGGSITAAKFLQKFVDKRPWAHLDIAGPSWVDSDSSSRDAGGTGCFVRTLVCLAEATGGARK